MTGPASEVRHLDVNNEACYCLESLGVASHDAFLLQIVVSCQFVPDGLRHAQIDRSSSKTTSLDPHTCVHHENCYREHTFIFDC